MAVAPRTIRRTAIDPYTMEWQDWVESTVGLNQRLSLPRQIDPNEDWREFAERLALSIPDTPYHDTFDDWRDWAAALRSALLL